MYQSFARAPLETKDLQKFPANLKIGPKTVRDVPETFSDARKTETSKGSPSDTQRDSNETQNSQNIPNGNQINSPNDTSKKLKLQVENGCIRHRDSDFTDATLKKHCYRNNLSPAECAERLSNTAVLLLF